MGAHHYIGQNQMFISFNDVTPPYILNGCSDTMMLRYKNHYTPDDLADYKDSIFMLQVFFWFTLGMMIAVTLVFPDNLGIST